MASLASNRDKLHCHKFHKNHVAIAGQAAFWGYRSTMGRGFSLVEVLVVVGVTLVLVAVLLPVLRSSRERAAASAAAVQVRTIATSLELYAETSKELYPVGNQDRLLEMQWGWIDPLVAGGFIPSADYAGKSISGGSIREIVVGLGMYAEPAVFSVEQLRPSAAQSVRPQRRSQVLFPSRKGNVLRANDGTGRSSFCCVQQWPSSVSFFDGSMFYGTRVDLSSSPVVVVEGIGFPIFTTWFGLSGVDR
jgi:competence protein ComGC